MRSPLAAMILAAVASITANFALDRIINERGLVVSWDKFIEAARRNGWWDFQTYDALSHAMIDAMLPREMQSAILDRFKLYVLRNPK